MGRFAGRTRPTFALPGFAVLIAIMLLLAALVMPGRIHANGSGMQGPSPNTAASPTLDSVEEAPPDPDVILPAAGGASAPESQPAVEPGYSSADEGVVSALGVDGTGGALEAVFLADEVALADPAFIAIASQLQQVGSGVFRGELTAPDLERIRDVKGLRVSQEGLIEVDDPTSPADVQPDESSFDYLLATVTTIPSVDPELAATRSSLGIQGAGQVIAIVDTGVDTSAVGLGGGKVIHRQDFSQATSSCSDGGYLDPAGHGTHVASIAAGAATGSAPGIEGVAPGASIVDVRVFNCASQALTSTVDAALQWIIDNHDIYGITVVNLSLGASGGPQNGQDTTSILVNRLVADGLIVSAAAGNGGDYASSIYSPGTARFATTVGAAGVTQFGEYLAPYSSQGPTDIGRGVDFLAAGSSIKAAKSTALTAISGNTLVENGTSMAAPYVAGLAALLLQQSPDDAPSGSSCSVGPSCLEGVVIGSVSNSIEGDISASDWFAAGPDDASGKGLVHASATLKRVASPAAAHLEAALDPLAPNYIEIPPHAGPVTVSLLLGQPEGADARHHFEYVWMDNTGATWEAQGACNLTVTTVMQCSWLNSTVERRDFYFYSAPTTKATFLKLTTDLDYSLAVSVPGLDSAVTIHQGIRAADVALDSSGTATVMVERAAASPSATILQLEPTGGLLVPASVMLPAGPKGTSATFVVTVDGAIAPVSPGSGGRVAMTVDGSLIDVVSIQYPPSPTVSGQVLRNGEQFEYGYVYYSGVWVSSNGTIAAASTDPLFERAPAVEGGWYVGPFVVDPDSDDAKAVGVPQTSVSSIQALGISGDGNRVLLYESGPGAGAVPGDGDDRGITFVHDRASGNNFEVGSSSKPTTFDSYGRAEMSTSGSAAAFMSVTSGIRTLYWQGGTNFGTTTAVATFADADEVRVAAVTDSKVVIEYSGAWTTPAALRVYTVGTGSYVTASSTVERGSTRMSPDESAIAYATANDQDARCYRMSSGQTVSFDEHGQLIAYGEVAAGDNCAYVVTSLERVHAFPIGRSGFELAKLLPSGNRTVLAATTDDRYSWVLGRGGDQVLTVTGVQLNPADTNGLYDIYRGAYGSPTMAVVPSVSGLSPNFGPADGGTSVTLTGAFFTGATGVTFGAMAGTNVVVDSDTQMTVTTPAHPVGAVDLVVVTPAGASPAKTFTYVAAQRVVGPSGFGDGITRLSGASRYETAVGVSRQFASGVPAVFVATGTNFPDALSAAAAAAYVGGPLLLTTPTELPATVKAEIIRLAPGKIYVIGGTGAVSESVANELAAIAPVTRYGGENRYDTGLQIVDGTFTSSTTAILATGRSFPDALAATGVAGTLGAPVILVDGTEPVISSATLSTLARLGVTDVIIAGGTAVVSTSIETQLRDGGYQVTRYGGADRYSTAALINSAFFPYGSTDTMFLATGTNFPDALAGAALAGRLGAPLYITTPGCAPTPIHDSIVALAPSKIAVLGGTTVVSDNAARNEMCG